MRAKEPNVKRKEFITEEYKVVKVIEGQGAWTGYAKRFIGHYDGTEFGSGVRGLTTKRIVRKQHNN